MDELDRPMSPAEAVKLAAELEFQNSQWYPYFNNTKTKLALIDLANETIITEPTRDACQHPERVLLSAMRYGTLEIFLLLEQTFTEDALRLALTYANTSNLDGPSWSYWHYRLGLPSDQKPPTLPQKPNPK